jgi:hypothetical protein
VDPRDLGELALPELFQALKGQEILFLGCHKIRTVDREEHLSFLDMIAGRAHPELVDPAVELDRHLGQAPLVHRHPADRPDDFL